MITKKHLRQLERLEEVLGGDDFYHIKLYSDMSGRIMNGEETLAEFDGKEGLEEALTELAKL